MVFTVNIYNIKTGNFNLLQIPLELKYGVPDYDHLIFSKIYVKSMGSPARLHIKESLYIAKAGVGYFYEKVSLYSV